MKSQKKQRPQLYVVEWLDIKSDATWQDESPTGMTPATCVTVGWLVFDGADKIVLADSRSKDGDWGGCTVIPTGVVVKKSRVSAKSPESFMGSGK